MARTQIQLKASKFASSGKVREKTRRLRLNSVMKKFGVRIYLKFGVRLRKSKGRKSIC